MSVETPFQLKHTNVSRPRLSHSGSAQSIAASEGYYSLSENTSSEGDDRSKLTPNRYHTPPSRNRSPVESHESLQHQTEGPTTSLKGVGIPRHPQSADERAHPHLRSPAVSTIAEERPETQAMDSESLATSPGMDNTPYIRFAIDQLTRDEEVRGSRMYPNVDVVEEEDYPIERIVSDDGLGYLDREQQRERRMSRPQPPPPKTPKSIPKPPANIIPIPIPPPATTSTATQDIFVPFRPSPDSLPHAPLNFMPSILRPLWLGLLIFLCLLMVAGLIFSAIYSNRSDGIGLWDYTRFGGDRYFVFEYLPTMLGMFILLWLLQVQVALQRMVPFISMASESSLQRSEAPFLQLYPTQFLMPRLEYFKAGHAFIGVFFCIAWLFSWTIPLLASSFNVRYITRDLNTWRWIAVQGVIWTVIVLYILLILALVALLLFLARKQTGLKWDPRSLADIVALLERSNIVNEYSGAETFEKNEFRAQLSGRSDRIGYWSTTRRPNDVFYGIGEEGGITRRYSVENGRIREKGSERSRRPDPPLPGTQQQSDFSIRMDIRSPKVRLKYLPWYLRDTSVVAWIVIAVILLIAFYVISFVNSAVRLGFLPQVFARTTAGGFSASNFLYSFIPALIGHFLFLVLLTFDYSLRALRPYISLSTAGGATAESSLLIDYSSRLPLSATLAAFENAHYQNALISFISLCSCAIPVVAGGCFWTQYYESAQVVRVAAELPGYYALCFFLGLYALAIFALIPNRRRAALPHRSETLAETISWVYQSPILADRAFSRPQTKPELVTRLMGSAYTDRSFAQSLTNLIRPSRDNLRGDSPTDPTLVEKQTKSTSRKPNLEKRVSVLEPGKIKYGFGIHVGRDGLEHLGIDRVRRGGERSGRELVIFEEQRRAARGAE
ncbi:hypothetical protein EJ04DRAFT_539468 [Polyplosphaeria fusca]|uniref:Phosphoribosylaminoimidazole-succinocarboxamide synthase protein n=1 Tax=Polyplosphaeria fusca TaxID=682080 RepID=A0A9P4V636_9PLEO|nr:hypothetical protein EJ04DRAFT_539468 [Polyplosphaeria fusca]